MLQIILNHWYVISKINIVIVATDRVVYMARWFGASCVDLPVRFCLSVGLFIVLNTAEFDIMTVPCHANTSVSHNATI